MKIWHVIIYGILIFFMSFASLSVTGQLVTEYLMPQWNPTIADATGSLSHFITMSNTYFNRALAFSFFIFLLLFSPVAISFIFKTSVSLNFFISVMSGILLWLAVKFFSYNLFLIFYPTINQNNYAIDLNPFYTLASFVIGGAIVVILFLFSFIRTADSRHNT